MKQAKGRAQVVLQHSKPIVDFVHKSTKIGTHVNYCILNNSGYGATRNCALVSFGGHFPKWLFLSKILAHNIWMRFFQWSVY